MRKLSLVFILSFVMASVSGLDARAEQQTQMKEWTFLVFLNGNNNLDSYGTDDLNEMEKVGSTEDVNVVVQWASQSARKVRRLYVQKDTNPSQVTSPVVQDMGSVDMGDYRNLVEFVRWGVQNYPAKHYFVDVWNHGAGWHRKRGGGIQINDISFDDITGNFITTEQLGQAMKESAQIIGHKVDIYGSDACLMAMAEVAGEMKDSVEYFVGSEEVEPAKGWPYDALLKKWTEKKGATGADVAKALTHEYVRSYTDGTQGHSEVQLSAFDLKQSTALNQAISGFGERIRGLDAADRSKVAQTIQQVLSFTYSDYGDLSDFLNLTEKAGLGARAEIDVAISNVRQAISKYVISNDVTTDYERAGGVAFWLPGRSYSFDNYATRYAGLQFNKDTSWLDALTVLKQDLK